MNQKNTPGQKDDHKHRYNRNNEHCHRQTGTQMLQISVDLKLKALFQPHQGSNILRGKGWNSFDLDKFYKGSILTGVGILTL